MSQLGMGVMLKMMVGDREGGKVLESSLGKTIKSLTLGSDDALHFVFDDDTKMKMFDDGQSCCESRYMRTDDRLEDFFGAQLLDFEIKDAPPVHEDGWETHDVQFLEIKTTKGSLTMASHNEHNGYYGGFYIVARSE